MDPTLDDDSPKYYDIESRGNILCNHPFNKIIVYNDMHRVNGARLRCSCGFEVSFDLRDID